MVDYKKYFNISINEIHAITLPQVTPTDSISLHLGYPDPKTFPVKKILDCTKQVLGELGEESLQYCEEKGDSEFRETICGK